MNGNSRIVLALAIFVWSASVGVLLAQTNEPAAETSPRAVPAPWRPAFGSVANTPLPSEPQAADQAVPTSNSPAPEASEDQPQRADSSVVPAAAVLPVSADRSSPELTRVTSTTKSLPNNAGQIWREYDISPYTTQIRNSANPQQAVLDWVLRETGTEMWFNQPLGILSANRNQLRVYHTPEIHAVIKPIVDRFVRTQGQLQNIDVNLVTVGKPNWRSQAYSMMQSIDVNSPGVEAWLISKENAALLLNQLSRRGDFRQHSGGRLTNHDGQPLVLENYKPVQFIRKLKWAPEQAAGFQPEMTTMNEGYRLEISCLTSLDNRSIEAMIKCCVDQVEKLDNVSVNVPGVGVDPVTGVPSTQQSMNLQIPQLVSWRLHERFRWPDDHVLLLGCGVVASPDPQAATGRSFPLLGQRPRRAEALLFIDYRGPATEAAVPKTARPGLAPVRPR